MATIDAAVAGSGLVSEFQPVIDLSDESIVGFEALSRWQSLDISSPQTVFARAAEIGRLDEVDELCIVSAVDAALRHLLPRQTILFVNCEPTTRFPQVEHGSALARARDEFQVVFELTERNLLTRPRELLSKVAALRSDGFAIALDDVGAHPDSLALLDVINPDVVKLDRRLVQSQTRYDQARVLAAVLAHRERTGAVILAEGIETEEHRELALAMGATLGQGFLFGSPKPLSEQHCVSAGWSLPTRNRPRTTPPGNTPFEIVSTATLIRTARKETLVAISRHLETQAGYAPDRPMVLTSLQHSANFTGETRRLYETLASSLPLVGVFGQDLPDLGPTLRGILLDPADPLSNEWVVLVHGAQAAFALISREKRGTAGDDRATAADRWFEFAITYDRTVVTAAARSLLERMH